MAERAVGNRVDAALRLTAALIPTAVIALHVSVLAARWLPCTDGARFCVAYYLPLPLWLVLACAVARTRRGGRAWLGCASLAAALQLLTTLL